MTDAELLHWAARVLGRHRHNLMGNWEVDGEHVVQVYEGAVVTVLTAAQAVEIAGDYEAKPEQEEQP